MIISTCFDYRLFRFHFENMQGLRCFDALRNDGHFFDISGGVSDGPISFRCFLFLRGALGFHYFIDAAGGGFQPLSDWCFSFIFEGPSFSFSRLFSYISFRLFRLRFHFIFAADDTLRRIFFQTFSDGVRGRWYRLIIISWAFVFSADIDRCGPAFSHFLRCSWCFPFQLSDFFIFCADYFFIFRVGFLFASISFSISEAIDLPASHFRFHIFWLFHIDTFLRLMLCRCAAISMIIVKIISIISLIRFICALIISLFSRLFLHFLGTFRFSAAADTDIFFLSIDFFFLHISSSLWGSFSRWFFIFFFSILSFLFLAVPK